MQWLKQSPETPNTGTASAREAVVPVLQGAGNWIDHLRDVQVVKLQPFTPYSVPDMAINKDDESRAGNSMLAKHLLQHGMQSLVQLLRRLFARLVAWATTAACRLPHACQKHFRQALQSRIVRCLLEALQRAYAHASAALTVSATQQASAELQGIQKAAAESCRVSCCPTNLHVCHNNQEEQACIRSSATWRRAALFCRRPVVLLSHQQHG